MIKEGRQISILNNSNYLHHFLKILSSANAVFMTIFT